MLTNTNSFEIVTFRLIFWQTRILTTFAHAQINRRASRVSALGALVTCVAIGLCVATRSWWRHQMGTFSALLAICAGNSPVTGEFPTRRPVTRSLGVFFDLHPNKRLSKHWWGLWFETPPCQLWRYCNVLWGSPHETKQPQNDQLYEKLVVLCKNGGTDGRTRWNQYTPV